MHNAGVGEDSGDATDRFAWDYLGSGVFSGRENMNRDRELLAALREGRILRPVVRLYRWRVPTVSLGVNQVSDKVVNEAELRTRGYDLVTRPTGGRALLHKGDLCYAMAARRNWHPAFKTLRTTYREISTAITLALSELGVAMPLTAATTNHTRQATDPCFAMFSPFEVAVEGRKICGSAQFRSGEVFLQHGSLRVEDNWDSSDLRAVWPGDVEIDASMVTSLERELKRAVATDEVERALLTSLANHFGITLAGA